MAANERPDFRAMATELLKRITPPSGAPVNRDLARSSLEIALKDSFEKGLQACRPVDQEKRPVTKTDFRAQVVPPTKQECPHEWDEAFLDRRSVGTLCLFCGISQEKARAECEHFYVPTGGAEVCVACRKVRRERV